MTETLELTDTLPTEAPNLPMPTSPSAGSLDELAGIDEIKAELREQIRLWADPEPLRRLGGMPRIGFIFAVPTGTGKTTAAHALAAETGRELFAFSGPDFAGEEGRARLSTVLTTMGRRPAVVFIDEADDLLHARDFERERSESLVKHLLVGLDRTTRVIRAFFVFATNLEARAIDPALCHPGRLGRPIVFRGLAARERAALLTAQAASFRLAPDVDLSTVAAQLGGVPTATLVHVLDEAAFVAAVGDHTRIETGDLQEAVGRLLGGLARMRTWDSIELRRVAIHEAGHALVAIVLAGAWDAVPWVQVDARAEGGLGLTFRREIDVAETETQIRHRIVIAVAGRAAEVLLTGEADIGSAMDLRTANWVAIRATQAWGMSERGLRLSRRFPEAVIEAEVDEAAGALVHAADAEARSILEAHREALQTLSERLVLHRAGSSADIAGWLADLLPIDPPEAAR